jgi:hypothetical protein
MAKHHLLSISIPFICQFVFVTLQRMQASSILGQLVAMGFTTFCLAPSVQNPPPLPSIDLFQAIGS